MRIVTRHMIRRTAKEKQELIERHQVYASKSSYSVAFLAGLKVAPGAQLSTRKEARRFFKWAVVEL